MTVDVDIAAALRTVCPRVSPDFAPATTPRPYVTFQMIGGRSLRYAPGEPTDKRHSLVQVNVWAASRIEAQALVRQIEAKLCDTPQPFTATPEAEPVSDVVDDIEPALYGAIQDFSVISTR